MSKKTGHLVYYKKNQKMPEVTPFEYDDAPRQAAEKAIAVWAKMDGMINESWSYCTEGRYVAVYDEVGYDYVECHSTENCWNRMYTRDYLVYDTVKKRWLSKDPWDDRNEITENSQEAIEVLSSQLFLNFDSMDQNKLDEMSEFAKKWNIPFSAKMIGNFTKMFVSQFPEWNWNSSSAYC